MKKVIGLLIVLLAGYLLLWPIPVEPVAWKATPDRGYNNEFAVNERMAGIERLGFDGLHGPEAIARDDDGLLYISSHEGWIVRHEPEAASSKRWVNTGGRPLGLAFDKTDNLLVADAYKGLLSIAKDGTITVLADQVDGKPIEYADDVDIAPDGRIYFSDASTKFGAEAYGGTYEASLLDLLEHGYHGRLLVYDPATRAASVVFSGLSFANGVAVDPEGRFVLVNETGEYRIHKVWLLGDKAGQTEVLIDGLPGFPDNIVRGEDGRYWVGLVSPRAKALETLADKPFLREITARLPGYMRPAAQYYGHVFAVDENGNVLTSLQAPDAEYHTTTGAIEADGWLYISSLHEDAVGRLPIGSVLEGLVAQRRTE